MLIEVQLESASVQQRGGQHCRSAQRLDSPADPLCPTCIIQIKAEPELGPAEGVQLVPLQLGIQSPKQIQHRACGKGEGGARTLLAAHLDTAERTLAEIVDAMQQQGAALP